MSKKPVLVVMAAGMGSRYGGLKRIDPVDEYGNIIMDFSIYDAVEAGFEKVVFIIKKAIEKEFMEHIGKRMEKHVQVEYVFQELDKIPAGFQIPEDRVKPWGTGHAILCCKDVVDGPFAVGVSITETVDDKETQIIYFSSASMLSSQIDQAISGANSKLAATALTSMCDVEQTVVIPSKSTSYTNLVFTQGAVNTWSIITIAGIPLVLVVIGVMIWMKRRKQ